MNNRVQMIVGIMMSIILIFVAGCASEPAPTATPEPTPTDVPTQEPTITTTCIVTDVGSVEDGTFNQYAYEGLQLAVEEFNLDELILVRESDSEEMFEENINSCLPSGADIIVTVGFLLQDATLEAARENEDIYFIGVDQDFEAVEDAPNNVVGLQFREDQAGFLVGALAALTANEINADTIAGIYGIDVPAVKRYRNGYEQGALYINPDWEVGENILGEYVGSFTDTELGVQAAQDFMGAGAEVIFGAGGPVGSAAIVEAAQSGVYVIGVDQDEYFTTFEGGEIEGSEYLVSSALKRVDEGVLNIVGVLAEGQLNQFPGGENYVLTASRGGIGYAPKHDADLPDAIYDEVNQILRDMVAGDVTTGVNLETGELIEEATEEATEE